MTPDFIAPRYGEASLAEVVPGLLSGMGVEGLGDPLGLAGPRRAIVLLVDGLGWMWVQERADLLPFLAEQGGRSIDSPCPSTTVTGIGTLGTGLAPGQHGLVGYTLPGWQSARRLNLLSWKYETAGADPVDALIETPPETLQPRETMFDVATRHGIDATAVLRREYTSTGLTRAALRGARTMAASGLTGTLDAAVAAATSGDRTLVYANHGDVDRAGHGHGPETEPWEAAVIEVDEQLERIAADLPADVDLYVTAGHGMVDVPPDGYLELADEPDLMAGVVVLAGEPRFRSLRVREGSTNDVVTVWREHAGHRFEVVTREEAIEAGWFGPAVRPEVQASLGEVLVLPRGLSAAVHRDLDPQWWRLSGHHGSLTRPEVEVPLVRITRTG
jgi:hypothetical protein